MYKWYSLVCTTLMGLSLLPMQGHLMYMKSVNTVTVTSSVDYFCYKEIVQGELCALAHAISNSCYVYHVAAGLWPNPFLRTSEMAYKGHFHHAPNLPLKSLSSSWWKWCIGCSTSGAYLQRVGVTSVTRFEYYLERCELSASLLQTISIQTFLNEFNDIEL